jgi:predicted phosphodiesterase
MKETWSKVLKRMQKSKFGLPLSEIEDLVNGERVSDVLDEIRDNGYELIEIGGIEPRWNLVKFYERKFKHFKPMGEVETPLALAADAHMGSEGYSKNAWRQFTDDCIDNDVNAVLFAGDLLQGLGVHRLEAGDLRIFKIDQQEDLAVEQLKMLEGIPIHLVHGNHEEKIMSKHQIGHDSCKAIARRVPNCTYYGWGCNLTLNGEHQLFMEHTSGSLTYAQSYRVQRIFDNLMEKPDVFVTGHLHQLGVFYRPGGHSLIQAGTFQRQNSFLAQKGHAPSIGWIVLKGWSKEVREWREVTPVQV